jgi:hypothetical protein
MLQAQVHVTHGHHLVGLAFVEALADLGEFDHGRRAFSA